jgi:hypothetical protein
MTFSHPTKDPDRFNRSVLGWLRLVSARALIIKI